MLIILTGQNLMAIMMKKMKNDKGRDKGRKEVTSSKVYSFCP